MIRRPIPFLLAVTATTGALLATASAQGASQAPPMDLLLQQWREAHGSSWQAKTNTQTGHLEMLYGGHVRSETRPTQDAQFEALALEALLSTQAMHGLDLETLELQYTRFLPLGQFNTTDKEAVRYRQHVNGVRVVDGFANVLFSANGELLSVQSTGLPNLAGFDTEPTVQEVQATANALTAFVDMEGMRPTHVDAPELVVDSSLENGMRVPRLAWLVNVQWKEPNYDPVGWRFSVDARDGSIVRYEPSIHFDVSGTVSAMASPGIRPDLVQNPPAQIPVKYVRCTSSAGTVFTDGNGNFNYPGVNTPLTVTFHFTQGSRANVFNNAGAEYTLAVNLNPNVPNSVLLNSAPTQHVTAQANVHHHLARASEYIQSIIPGDNTANFSALANANLNNNCNAFFDGGSTNYYVAGSGCPNTGYSTVVAHEFGHWLNVLYGTGNGSDGMGEGNADTWALYIYDTHILGSDFFGNGNHLRLGTNNRQFCGDCCANCHGGVHNSGEVWMGAAWKVRTNLKNAHGTVPGGLIADTLFMGWMTAYNQTQIRSIIETQWITLDDDNGNILDGSPNFDEIDLGFRAQGFPGLVVQCPTPTNYCATTPNSAGPGAILTYAGTNEISNNDFVVIGSGLPANKLVIPFYGQFQTFTSFGNGMRCIANPFFRLPTTMSGMFGDVNIPIDLNNLPSGGDINVGETWNFQVYFRDPAGGGAAFDASDAIEVEWCN